MSTGRLLRQAKQQQSFPACTCDHAVEDHREDGTPGVFPCSHDACVCTNYEPGK